MNLTPIEDAISTDHDTSKILMEIVDAKGVTVNVAEINSDQFGDYSPIVQLLSNPMNAEVSVKQSLNGLTINYSHPKLK